MYTFSPVNQNINMMIGDASAGRPVRNIRTSPPLKGFVTWAALVAHLVQFALRLSPSQRPFAARPPLSNDKKRN